MLSVSYGQANSGLTVRPRSSRLFHPESVFMQTDLQTQASGSMLLRA